MDITTVLSHTFQGHLTTVLTGNELPVHQSLNIVLPDAKARGDLQQ